MDYENILKLVDAGFTKDEIMAMSAPKAPEATEAPKAETPETPENEALPEAEQIDTEEVKKNSLSDSLERKLEELTRKVEQINRENVVIKAPEKEDTESIFISAFGLEKE